MKSARRHGIGWFAALRRDRALFALAASFILVAHLFQPWAQARAASTANAWVICTALGMEMPSANGSDLPPGGMADDCPRCLAAFGAPLAKLSIPATQEIALPTPKLVLALGFPNRLVEIHPDRLSQPPPAIRAPPFTA